MAGKELENRLIEDAHKLFNLPFSIDDLLSILDRVEVSLSKVNQSPNGSMIAVLSPLRIALVSDKLLRHIDADVKVHVAACISQIIRITAPEPPYNDEKMTEIFHLIVAILHKLSHLSGCCYSKVVSILDTIAKTRAVVLMIDLHCHALINNMFGLFLMISGSNNSDVISAAMVTIMTIVILESDDISLEIVIPLLACVRKENQNVAPAAWKLGKKVIKNCSAKIGPYVLRAIRSLGVSMDSYDPIIGSICQKSTKNFESFDSQCYEELLSNNDGTKTRCKIISENAKLEETADKGQFVDFPDVHKILVQQPASAKTCLDQELRLALSEDAFPANRGRVDVCSGMTLVQGYEVKTALAPILTAIFTKYGDIVANCKYKSPKIRAGLLEIVADIVRRLQNFRTPLALSDIKILKNEMKDLEGADLELSWLTRPLEKISEVEKVSEVHSMLKSVKESSTMVIKAATKELEEALMELVALQKRMGEAEKRINAMKLVVRKVDDAIKEAEVEELLWLRQINKKCIV